MDDNSEQVKNSIKTTVNIMIFIHFFSHIIVGFFILIWLTNVDKNTRRAVLNVRIFGFIAFLVVLAELAFFIPPTYRVVLIATGVILLVVTVCYLYDITFHKHKSDPYIWSPYVLSMITGVHWCVNYYK